MVSLDVWCETIKKYPLKFKYKGFRGFHSSLCDAMLADDRSCSSLFEAMVEDTEKSLLHDYPEDYGDYLVRRLRIGRHDAGLIRKYEDGFTGDATNIAELEAVVGDKRYEYASESVQDLFNDEGYVRDSMQYEADDRAEYHQEEEVYNAAYDCGFPVQNVVYVCPSCHAHAMTTDELEDNGGRHYCSLCGSEWLEKHCFTDGDDGLWALFNFAREFQRELFPFRGFNIGEQVIVFKGASSRDVNPDPFPVKTIERLADEGFVFTDGTTEEYGSVLPAGVLVGNFGAKA
jgi:hypothetical protein